MLQRGISGSFIGQKVNRHIPVSTKKHKRYEEDQFAPVEDFPPIISRFMDLFQVNPRVGGMLIGTGLLVSMLGMMLFFERNLLRIGNLMIVIGIPLLVGPSRVKNFFWKKSRIQAAVITCLGVLLVLFGKPRLGIMCEIFGLLNLFGNMLPLLLAIPKRLPFIGDVLTAVLDAADNTPPINTKNGRFPEF